MTRPPPAQPDRLEQAARLQRWLDAWETWLALAPESEDAPPPAMQSGPAGPQASLQVGDIVLLPPALCPDAVRYAAITELQDGTAVTLAPFGLFDEPATPDEVSLDRPFPLCVVCAWNPIRLPARSLATAWRVDGLADGERARVRAAAAADPGRAVADAGRGPPLVHPLDPRHAYRDVERGFAERVARAAAPGTAGKNATTYPFPAPPRLRLAAEDPSPAYGETPRDAEREHD